MKRNDRGKAPFYLFEHLSKCCEITHFISTRHGGVSEGPYHSLNMGLGTDDEPSAVLQNRRILAESVGIPLKSFVILNQVHQTNVTVITSQMKGAGAMSRDSAILETDAVVTNEKGICLFVMAADCVSLLFYDPKLQVIGAAHAGWRGTVKNMALHTVRKMQETYGSNPSDIIAGIGPSIGPCCYGVGSDVIDAVAESFGKSDGFIRCGADFQPHFDLWYTNRHQLLHAGVPEEQIETAGICTMCEHLNFFSSRADNGITGRFGAGIMLK